jgi:hypothetical protein
MGRRSTRKIHVYKRNSRKSKKTTRRIKRRNKQSIKTRKYRGGSPKLENIEPLLGNLKSHAVVSGILIKAITLGLVLNFDYKYGGVERQDQVHYNFEDNTMDVEDPQEEDPLGKFLNDTNIKDELKFHLNEYLEKNLV